MRVCIISFCLYMQKTAYEMRISDWSSDVCSSDLVVEAQRVVAQGAGFRARHFLEDAGAGLGLGDAVAQHVLRRDAGDERGHRRGQQVVGRLDEELHRRLDLVELRIGADRGELRDPAAARVGAEGFEIVEEEACGHGFWDWRCLLEWVLAGAALRQAQGKASAASSC